MLYHFCKNYKALSSITNILNLNGTTKNRNKRPPENIHINGCFPKQKSQPLNYKLVGFSYNITFPINNYIFAAAFANFCCILRKRFICLPFMLLLAFSNLSPND